MKSLNSIYFAALFLLLLVSCSSRSDLKEKAAGSSPDSRRRPANETNKRPQPNSPTNKPRSAEQLSLSELFKKNNEAVFLIYTSTGEETYQGSGFFISADGIAISNYHVFEGTLQGSETIQLANRRQLKIESILAKNKENDYIIFKVKTSARMSFIPIANRVPEIGEDVFAIGNPKGLEHTLSEGIISGYRESKKLLQTTTEITNGSSGGPLLNMKGEVVGITTSGMGEANLNFAINIKKLNLNRYLR